MYQELTINQLNNATKGSLLEQLGMEFTLVEEGKVEAIMPVDSRTIQPVGILHGGATIALAESVAGLGSDILCPEGFHAVGMQLNVNHLSSPRSGKVKAVGKLLHRGKRSHVWQVEVHDDDSRLVSVVTVTNLIIKIELP
jgi:1,4-dihydroxy-2-naphthoyl-CoA hydrolase